MSWSGVTAGTTTSWTTTADSTVTWSGTDVGPCPPPWVQLSSVVTTVDTGVDFQPRVNNQYPMRVCSDRPVRVASVYPEGTP